MTEVAMTDAQKRLSELANRARYGREEFILTSHGEPMAKLVPCGGGEHGKTKEGRRKPRATA